MDHTFNLKSRDYQDLPEKKRYFNEQLFTEVAPTYDFITRALSLGRDAAWKKHLMDALPASDAPFCVDLACGTGDVSYLLAERYPDGTVLGVDLTESMLKIALERNPPANLSFVRQDMCLTRVESRSADIVTGSYALRNAPDLKIALNEIHRILKPGGVGAFLDFSKPSATFLQVPEYWLLKGWGSMWGLLMHGNHEVYAYIAESLRIFPDRVRLRECLAEVGFTILESRRFYFGIMELLVFKR